MNTHKNNSLTQFKHDLLEAYMQYQYEQEIIENVFDGYDIAEQQIDMNMEEGFWYEETFEMMCDMFGEAT